MRKILSMALASAIVICASAQNTRPREQAQSPAAPREAATKDTSPKEEKSASPSRTLNPDHQVVTEHEVTIKGQKVPYRTTTGTMPVWDDDGKIIASLFYIYYERTDI